MAHFPMLCKARWAQMPAERAHTFLATRSRMQNHRSKERRAAQRRLYSRLSTLKRRKSCGRGTPCVNTIFEAIPSIMLRETPDDRRVAAPGLHFVVVWKRFSAGLAPVQKPSNRGLSEEKLVYLPPKGFFNRSCRFFDLKKKLWGVPVEAKILSPRADAIKVVLHVSFYKKKF